ncbi:MAG: hypothetical protein RIS86_511 [Planctomycetota bacterium]
MNDRGATDGAAGGTPRHEADAAGDATRDDATHPAPPPLGADDAEAVDALLDHGFDAEAAVAAHPALAARIRAASSLFAALDRYPVEPQDDADADALVDATLARIARVDAAREDRMRIPATTTAVTAAAGRGRWPDVFAVASAALILLSIGLPLADWLSTRRNIARCGATMGDLAGAFERYTQDNGGSLPVRAQLLPDLGVLDAWHRYRNGGHLRNLSEGGYCEEGHLGCPCDQSGEGFSYQVPSPRSVLSWRSGVRLPVLADRNPAIPLVARGEQVGACAINSPEHEGKGENVLFTDGSVAFLVLPIVEIGAVGGMGVHQENIWLPMTVDRVEQLEHGIDRPAQWVGFDVFLMQ